MNTALLTYLNTRQHFTNHWHGDVFSNSFYLSDFELKRWNVTRVQLEALPQVIKIDDRKYNIKGVDKIDISLLKPAGKPLNQLHQYMMNCLLHADLPKVVESTPYFRTFLKHCSRYPELFFKVDNFSSRVHSPISGMSKTIRPFLLLQGEQTLSFDVAQMQPTLLGLILQDTIGNNDFSATINAGVDVYVMLQEKAKLTTRNEAKDLFFSMLFGKPLDELSKLFDKADFIQWINWYKSNVDIRNPHSKEKNYSNLAWLLQTYEVAVMGEVWAKLAKQKIMFLTVHDEIICKKSDAEKVRTIFESVLNSKFKRYKLNESTRPSPIGPPLLYDPKPQPIERKVPAIGPPSVGAPPKEKTKNINDADDSDELTQRLSLSDVAMQIIGERNHLSRQNIIDRMVQLYQIDSPRAETGLKSLIDSKLIEPTRPLHIGTFMLVGSTPF